ncbi:hypothetical protein SAMN05216466_1225 [Paraburkholderia phenazinium]|uniref:OmpA family protein n=1 Tax=Paraburkholderia phenazinium TaxID=60549 RepID=A0A1G8K6M6_9BURK|nr:hypothetical protein SAMN05216466_1225 [Paraburkholderia phenazinium]
MAASAEASESWAQACCISGSDCETGRLEPIPGSACPSCQSVSTGSDGPCRSQEIRANQLASTRELGFYTQIFRSITVKILHLAPILSALSLAACSSASGPTFNAYELQPRDGVRTYQVDCHGIFSSQATCMKVARRMCGDEPVRTVDSTKPFRDGVDPGRLVFQCGVPPAPTPEPVASNTTAEGRASNRRVEISLQH